MSPHPDQRPPAIEAVLFDFGQVLTLPPDQSAWALMGRITGLPQDRLHSAYWAERHLYDAGDQTGTRYWQAAGREAGLELTDEQISALLDADLDLWTQPNLPMIDWARRLKTAGIRIGILSNMGDAMKVGILARFAWLKDFDHHTWSHELGIIKPRPEIYAHASFGLAVEAPHILFVDDRADNIAGAEAAGMQAIQYVDQPDFQRQLQVAGLGALWSVGIS